jgi:phosphatidate cytidylyltransferase
MLKARVVTALILVTVLGAVLFAAPAWLVAIAFSLVAGVAAWEWGGLMRQDATARRLYALLVLFFCWQLLGIADEVFPLLFVASAVFWVLVLPFWLRGRWDMTGNDFVGYAVGLLVILPTWAGMISLQSRSPWILLAAMALVWVADVAAYFSGRAFGRRKLAPHISPGKTWEGVAGAVLGVLVYGAVLAVFAPDRAMSGIALSPLAMALLLMALTALSIVGDLFESLLKRHAQIKDSSQLLPGHGGVLDRIDSQTSTLPLVALLVMQWHA